MSGATTPQPKTMSSRLLTMKFMQRAAATSPLSTSPSTPDVPSPKRRKTENGSTPTKFDVDALADRRAIEAAMASEEAKRQIALEKLEREAGDTRWVLNFEDGQGTAASKGIQVVETSFASLDRQNSRSKNFKDRRQEDDQEEASPSMVGRRSFGSFNRVVEKIRDPKVPDAEVPDDDDEDEEDAEIKGEDELLDSDDPMSELIRSSRQAVLDRVKAERKAAKKAKQSESDQMAKDRKKREVSLNGITSLSGRQEPARSGVKCYNCNGPHFKSDCPLLNKRGFDGNEDDGPRRKAQRSH